MALSSAVPIDAAPRVDGGRLPAPLSRAARALLLPGLLLLSWALAASCRWLPPQILPAPLDVATALRDLRASAETASQAACSARRLAGGFAVGALLGLGFAAVMRWTPLARDCLFPPLEAVARVPVLGWLPLLLLLPMGIGEMPVRLLVMSQGLGFLIAEARAGGQPDRMLAAAMLVGAGGWLLDRLLAGVEARLAKRRGMSAPAEEGME